MLAPLSPPGPVVLSGGGVRLAAGETDVDLSPLQLVADAFVLCRRLEVGAFAWNAV